MLYFLGIIGTSFIFIFIIFCISCGIQVINQYIEERPKQAHPILFILNACLIILHVSCLLFESSSILPPKRICFSLLTNLLFFRAILAFPSIKISSPFILVGLLMTVCNHFIWFDLFVKNQFPIPNIVAVYSLLVWLSPTSVMVCIGSQEYSLPFVHSYNKLARKEENGLVGGGEEKKVISGQLHSVGSVASRVGIASPSFQ